MLFQSSEIHAFDESLQQPVYVRPEDISASEMSALALLFRKPDNVDAGRVETARKVWEYIQTMMDHAGKPGDSEIINED